MSFGWRLDGQFGAAGGEHQQDCGDGHPVGRSGGEIVVTTAFCAAIEEHTAA